MKFQTIGVGDTWLFGNREAEITRVELDANEVGIIEVEYADDRTSQMFNVKEWDDAAPTRKEWYDDTPATEHSAAWTFFVASLNYSRHSVGMAHRTDGTVALGPILARFAVLVVMSKNVWLKRTDIETLLLKLRYVRSSGTIRTALRRIVKFGLAQVNRTHDKHNRYGRSSWKMTEAGYQFIQSPQAEEKAKGKPKKIKAPKVPRVRTSASKKPNGTQTAASAAPGGKTMCIDPNKPTLNQAIHAVANDFVRGQKKFSAHDVTAQLRDLVASDLWLAVPPIDVVETGSIAVSGKNVPYISHEYVRDAVHELFHQGKLTDCDRSHNGTYWEYTPRVALSLPDVSADADPDATPQPTGDDPPRSPSGTYDGTSTI